MKYSTPRSRERLAGCTAFEQGAVVPSNCCAYEGPVIKVITGFPISLHIQWRLSIHRDIWNVQPNFIRYRQLCKWLLGAQECESIQLCQIALPARE